MPIACVNNIKIFYEQTGAGPDLILIAGFSATHDIWNTLIPLLRDQYRVTVLDNRGAGQSSSEGVEYSIEGMAHDVAALMQHLNISSAYYVGHSMGGLILQVLASTYPNTIKKAILLCSGLLTPTAFGFHGSVNAALKTAGVDWELLIKNQASFLFGPAFLNDKKQLDAFIMRSKTYPHPQTEAGLAGQGLAIRNFKRLEHLSRITVPTQALLGDADTIALLYPNQKLLKQHNPLIQVEMLENCGHMPQLECPLALSTRLKEYFIEKP